MNVDELLAHESIRQLKARYCLFVDMKRWAELEELFSLDARLEFNDRDTVVIGRSEIVAYIAAAVGDSLTSHHPSCADIEILAPAQARATWALHYATEGVAQVAYGFYEDEYHQERGTWRFSRLRRIRSFGHPALGE
jgi:hypothetical protein